MPTIHVLPEPGLCYPARDGEKWVRVLCSGKQARTGQLLVCAERPSGAHIFYPLALFWARYLDAPHHADEKPLDLREKGPGW